MEEEKNYNTINEVPNEGLEIQGIVPDTRLNQLKKISALIQSGVRFEDPITTYVDLEVEIESGSFIGAGTKLCGYTVIGKDVNIEGNTLIRDSTIGDRTLIRFYCYIDSSKIAEDCAVGPFAHLRPKSELKSEVHVGNFVEIKNSVLHPGVKAGHLSYLGDAVIGQKTNIGAGTITCNYDGVSKHQTVIGEEAFIGSDVALVAPVTIGDRAIVGAGSVITQDVPADALGIVRAEQKNLEGYAPKRWQRLRAAKALKDKN
jgi:bifunctional UDP-N-acetylglucosamine pyrophosphorylase / glucosamine-1-phosphate N-acetyltransferase